jgi:hypothetical protein
MGRFLSILDKNDNRWYTQGAAGKGTQSPDPAKHKLSWKAAKEVLNMLERIVAFLSEIELIPLE